MIDAEAIRQSLTLAAYVTAGVAAGALGTLAIQRCTRRARAARGGRP